MAALLAAAVCFLSTCVAARLGYRAGWLAGTAEPPLPATDDAEVARMFGMDPGTREDRPRVRIVKRIRPEFYAKPDEDLFP